MKSVHQKLLGIVYLFILPAVANEPHDPSKRKPRTKTGLEVNIKKCESAQKAVKELVINEKRIDGRCSKSSDCIIGFIRPESSCDLGTVISIQGLKEAHFVKLTNALAEIKKSCEVPEVKCLAIPLRHTVCMVNKCVGRK